jgi:hypothetical protein
VKENKSYSVGHLDVFSRVAVRQGAFKWSCAVLSWKPPRGRAGLFIPGRLAPLPSSSAVTQSARAIDYLAMLRPNSRHELIVGGA